MEDDGYDVRRAKNGLQAIDVINEVPFDLVMLDLEMPKMNGYDVCRAIRSNKRLETLPILVLSVHTDPQDIVAGFDRCPRLHNEAFQ